MILPLWAGQRRMLDFALSRDKAVWYADMSSGKTRAALEYLATGEGRRLVLTPLPVFSAWTDDINNVEFFTTAPFELVILQGSKQQKLDALANGPENGVYVVNYESAWRLPLANYNWMMVVADEAHRLGTYNSKQSVLLTRMLANVPRKVAMTGTPYTDGYEKLYGILRWLTPIIPENIRAYPVHPELGKYDDFLDIYCHTYRINQFTRSIVGYKNIDKLVKIASPYVVRIGPEYMQDLPRLVSRNYYADITGELRKAYDQLAKDNVILEDDYRDSIVATHVLIRAMRLQQLADSGQVEDYGGKVRVFEGLQNRVNTLKYILEECGDEPVVIFTRYRCDIEIIQEIVHDKCHLLTGDMDNHIEWTKGAGRILIANIGAGSEGVRLQRARHAIFWSVGYSAQAYQQAISRLRRLNQEADTVFVHNILSRNTIDETIYDIIARKNKDQYNLDNRIEDKEQ